MRGTIAIAVVLCALPACSDSSIRLLESGRSEHRIVLEPDASPSDRLAAQELRAHFKSCTGAVLPIVEGRPSDDVPMIVVGSGAIARSLGAAAPDAPGEQGARIRTAPPHLVIAGSRGGGTLYGVHRFLEERLGVRWLAPGSTITPRTKDVVVPAIDRVVRPAFTFRDTSYAWPGRDEDFLTRVADNAGAAGPDDPHGAKLADDGRAHTYFRYVSPDEFFDTHPEYFSMIGGVRRRDETQLCLTNPDVLEIVATRMLERMAAAPGVRQHNFSQMDHYNYCECPKCRAVNEKHKTTGGTQFWFLNQLAERTSKVFPDKLVGTLSYTYTEEPPVGLEMHPNVAVWLCHMYPSCDAHPIPICPLNADYRRRAEAWAKLVRHMYVWHYVVNFTHYYEPFPNLRALAANLRFYRDVGVEGVYLQGMGESGGGGEFSLLRPWFAMKLLQDPDQDPGRLLDDFLQGYYGASAQPVREYVDMLHDEVESKNVHMHLYTNPAQGYLSDPVLERAGTMFDRAENAAPDDESLERVRVARMPLTYAGLYPRNGYDLREGRLEWNPGVVAGSELVAFLDRMRAHGFLSVRESSGDPGSLLLAYALFSKPLEAVRISNAALDVDVVPLLAGRVLRIADRASGLDVLARDVRRGLYYPFSGGLEDKVGESFIGWGWVEPASVQDRTATSITTQASTMDGLTLSRRVSLAESEPVLHVETTVTNPGTAPRDVRLRSHLELSLGDVRGTRVRFADRAGNQVDSDMNGIVAALREGRHFYDMQAPAGVWEFSGSKGMRLVQRFDPEAVDFTHVFSYPEDLGEVEAEIWVRRGVLDAGESLVFRHDLEVRRSE